MLKRNFLSPEFGTKWATVTSLSLACQAATWTVCSPSWTLPHAWQLARSATTTSLRSLPTSTGCAYLSASSTSCATGLPVRITRVRTELSAERHLPGRECGITASPAVRVIGRSHRAVDATYNNVRPRLRRRSTSRLEQSARRDPSQLISGCLQTFTENSLLYSVLLLTLLLLLLDRASRHCKVSLK